MHQVTCELIRAGDVFVLEPIVRSVSTEYKLVTSSQLDREDRDEYQLTIVCHDAGVPALSRSRDLVVRVIDTNDHTPQFERRSETTRVALYNLQCRYTYKSRKSSCHFFKYIHCIFF